MPPRLLLAPPALLAGLLTVAAPPAAAFIIDLNADAFDLALALAPTPGVGVTVTGTFVEIGPSAPDTGAIGRFSDGTATLGIDSGIALGTGNLNDLFTGAPPTPGTDFGWSPAADTAALLAQIPGQGAGFTDTARLSLTIDPGLDAVFVNLDLAFGTNEVGLWTDRVGVFVNGGFQGLLLGAPLDQNHPWMGPAGSGYGMNSVLYPDGNPTAAPFVTVAVPVPGAGVAFALDFLIADVGDGDIDSALFLGNLRGSETPLGPVLVPTPAPLGLLVLGLTWLGLRRRTA